MRTSLPVRVERLWWVRRLRRLLRSLGTLPLVLDSHGQVRTLPQQLRQLRDIRRNPLRLVFGGQLGRAWPDVLPEVAAPLSGTGGKFFYAVRNDFRQLHHLLTQFGVFRNVALNAVAIGPQFSPERLKLTQETVNFAHRSL